VIDGREEAFFLNKRCEVNVLSSAEVPNGSIQAYAA